MSIQPNGTAAPSSTRAGQLDPNAAALPTYPYLRSVLAPEYASLPAAQLAAFMEFEYGEGAAEAYDDYFEGFFGDVGNWVSHAARDVGRVAQQAAPVVANIGGGVIKGATTGAALGPVGIIGGAITGGVGQGLASYGSGSLRDIGKGINTGLGVASQFTPTGRIGGTLGGALTDVGQGKNVLKTALGAASGLAGGALGGGALGGGGLGQAAGLLGGQGGSTRALAGLLGGQSQGGTAGALAGLLGGQSQGGTAGALTGLLGGQGSQGGVGGLLGGLLGGQGGSAANQLAALFQNSDMRRAIGSMAMGGIGRKSIPVGASGVPVPTSAFANLLGAFAQSAADEQAELADGTERNLAYLMDDAGEWAADPAEGDQRAARLASLLTAAELEQLIQDLQRIQLSQQQELVRQQLQIGQQTATRDRLRQTRAWQRQLDQETAMYDAMDLAEAAALDEGDGEFDEFDEFDETEFETYDEYDEYDELDDVA